MRNDKMKWIFDWDIWLGRHVTYGRAHSEDEGHGHVGGSVLHTIDDNNDDDRVEGFVWGNRSRGWCVTGSSWVDIWLGYLTGIFDWNIWLGYLTGLFDLGYLTGIFILLPETRGRLCSCWLTINRTSSASTVTGEWPRIGLIHALWIWFRVSLVRLDWQG